MTKPIKINEREIGERFPPYVIAELSANHNGRLDRALDIITMAKKRGADAVKLQTYTADTLTINCDKEDFQIHGGIWNGYNLYQLYEWAQTPFEWHHTLFEHARKVGITCFSSPFDESAVDLLEDLNAPAYKIASFEAIDLPLIRYVAQTKKPIIISTGMANLEEIAEAIETAREAGCNELVLLHCISGYPTPIEQSNLRTIGELSKRFDIITGLSDHTLGTLVSVTSVALGVSVIEKHVTLSRLDKGPDSEFSLEPGELEKLCFDTRQAWSALGEANFDLKPVEKDSVKFRRSLYVVEDINAGERFTERNVRRIRPGFGLPPKYFNEIIGKKASCDIRRGEALKWDHINKQVDDSI